jgi:hypothetical protein
LDANASLVSADSPVASETADSPFATDEDLDTGHLYTIKTRVYDPKYLARNEARVMNFRFKIGLLKVLLSLSACAKEGRNQVLSLSIGRCPLQLGILCGQRACWRKWIWSIESRL